MCTGYNTFRFQVVAVACCWWCAEAVLRLRTRHRQNCSRGFRSSDNSPSDQKLVKNKKHVKTWWVATVEMNQIQLCPLPAAFMMWWDPYFQSLIGILFAARLTGIVVQWLVSEPKLSLVVFGWVCDEFHGLFLAGAAPNRTEPLQS